MTLTSQEKTNIKIKLMWLNEAQKMIEMQTDLKYIAIEIKDKINKTIDSFFTLSKEYGIKRVVDFQHEDVLREKYKKANSVFIRIPFDGYNYALVVNGRNKTVNKSSMLKEIANMKRQLKALLK